MRYGEDVSREFWTHVYPVVNLFDWHNKYMTIGERVDAQERGAQ
jgi:hypothetical protein